MVQINCCGRIIKNRTIYQLAIAFIFSLILVVLIPTLALLNNSSSRLKTHAYTPSRHDPLFLQNNFNGAILWANISSIDTRTVTIAVRYKIIPVGTYSVQLEGGLNIFNGKVSFRSGGKTFRFDSDDLLCGAEVRYPISLGDPNQYPYDAYSSDFVLVMQDEK